MTDPLHLGAAHKQRNTDVRAERDERDADLIHEMSLALIQYRADITYPLPTDSAQRRVAMIDALLAKAQVSA